MRARPISDATRSSEWVMRVLSGYGCHRICEALPRQFRAMAPDSGRDRRAPLRRRMARVIATALDRLAGLPAARALAEAAAHLGGSPSRLLSGLALDGRLLEAIAARAQDGACGAVYTGSEEARVLAAFALAEAASRRGGPPAPEGV